CRPRRPALRPRRHPARGALARRRLQADRPAQGRRRGLTDSSRTCRSSPMPIHHPRRSTMPGLTVTEKSHWRDRIAVRIEKAVERIKARHPALLARIAREAHAQALTTLGLADAHAELEAIKAEEAALARRRKQAQKAMIAT